MVVSLTGALIDPVVSTNISPDRGHIHPYLDNALVQMDYALETDVSVQPGSWVLRAEFVASDHAPFDPRVWSPQGRLSP